jgi:hypothetical protein
VQLVLEQTLPEQLLPRGLLLPEQQLPLSCQLTYLTPLVLMVLLALPTPVLLQKPELPSQKQSRA